MSHLRLSNVTKQFGTQEVIHGIDLVVPQGSFTVFVGPSGCGKSTLLRMIAGLEDVTAGEIYLGERRCDQLAPSARGMAMVFQSYALFPHMTVYENLRFGLVCQKVDKALIRPRIEEAARLLQIEHLLERKPHQMSGGQNQRVAIGRAIVLEPDIFLFDEPLSNLDAELRVKMRVELAQLHRRLGNTMIYVTHDQVEAMTMADRIAVLREGRIEQEGTPLELYACPANRFVAGFLGTPHMNMLSAAARRTGGSLQMRLGGGEARVDFSARSGPVPEGQLLVGIRPEHLVLRENGPLPITVTAIEMLGGETIVHGDLPDGTALQAKVPGVFNPEIGQALSLDFDPRFAHAFDPASERSLFDNEGWRDHYVTA